MTLLEFGQRAFDRDGASFSGAAVQLTGFVAGAEDGGFRLARYQIACCAADAAPVVLRVVGIHGAPARDQWVTVTGCSNREAARCPSWRPRASSRSPRLTTPTSETRRTCRSGSCARPRRVRAARAGSPHTLPP